MRRRSRRRPRRAGTASPAGAGVPGGRRLRPDSAEEAGRPGRGAAAVARGVAAGRHLAGRVPARSRPGRPARAVRLRGRRQGRHGAASALTLWPLIDNMIRISLLLFLRAFACRGRNMRERRRRPRLEALEDRCVPATFGIPWSDAAHLTLSFAPDGTTLGPEQSTLFSTLDAAMPRAVWQREI